MATYASYISLGAAPDASAKVLKRGAQYVATSDALWSDYLKRPKEDAHEAVLAKSAYTAAVLEAQAVRLRESVALFRLSPMTPLARPRSVRTTHRSTRPPRANWRSPPEGLKARRPESPTSDQMLARCSKPLIGESATQALSTSQDAT